MKTKIIFIFIPLIFSLVLMLRNIDLPYVGPNATDLNTLSLAARNYNDFGLVNTKFAIIKTLSPTNPRQTDIYLHHPMLMVIAESLLFKILGYGFWVGRLTVIIPAFLSFILIFLAAKELKNTKFAIWTLTIASLIPSFIVFGRTMHFPGAFTMFFILLITYLSLKFIKTNQKIFFYASIFSAVLGTLSDWPMTFFSVFLLPFYIKNKKTKEGILLILASFLTALMFLFYAYFILGDFKNMSDAILNRSVGPLLFSLPFWPANWIFIILLRFIIYFNPIFVFISFIFGFQFIKRFINKNLNNLDLIIFAFFATGVTQIILYPEGSFGHPFWIYLLSPFIAFAASEILHTKLNKKLIATTLLIIFSFIFLLRIEDWKTKQNEADLYRYTLAKQISVYLKPYSTLAVNPDTYIEKELLTYSFYQNTVSVDIPSNNFEGARLYAYSCISCDLNNPDVNYLANKFKFKQFDAAPATTYLFFLTQKQTQKFEIKKPEIQLDNKPASEIRQNFLKKTYMDLKDLLKAPQI